MPSRSRGHFQASPARSGMLGLVCSVWMETTCTAWLDRGIRVDVLCGAFRPKSHPTGPFPGIWEVIRLGFASDAVIPSAWQGGVTGAHPLVFLHGAGADSSRFDRLGALLTNRVAVDLPGHGAAGGAPLSRVSEMAEAVEALLDREGLEEPILVGHSMGGAVALTVALRQREGPRDTASPRTSTLSGLGLLSTATRLRVAPTFLDALAQGRLPEPFLGFLYGPMARPVDVDLESTSLGRAVLNGVLEMDLRACQAFDVSDQAGELAITASVVTGNADRMTPPSQAQRLHDWFAKPDRVRLTLVEGSGHYVMVERPEATAAALTELRDRVVGLGRSGIP